MRSVVSLSFIARIHCLWIACSLVVSSCMTCSHLRTHTRWVASDMNIWRSRRIAFCFSEGGGCDQLDCGGVSLQGGIGLLRPVLFQDLCLATAQVRRRLVRGATCVVRVPILFFSIGRCIQLICAPCCLQRCIVRSVVSFHIWVCVSILFLPCRLGAWYYIGIV